MNWLANASGKSRKSVDVRILNKARVSASSLPTIVSVIWWTQRQISIRYKSVTTAGNGVSFQKLHVFFINITRWNLKADYFLLWKLIECFPSTIRRRNLKTWQSTVILDSIWRPRDYREVIVFEKLISLKCLSSRQQRKARTPERAVWVRALAGEIVLCSWQDTLLSQRLSPPSCINGYPRIVGET